MSTGRPNPYIVGSSTYGVAWRGYPKAQFTGSSSMPSQAHKIPRHGIVMGLAFSAMCYWEAQRRKEKDQIETDLPYLTHGSEPLSPGATPPGESLKAVDAADSPDESRSSRPQVTHATMPLYPLGHNPGGPGPHDDPDLSHLGLQIDYGNRLEKRVQITDLEKIENSDHGTKGYSWDKLKDKGSVMTSRYGQPAMHRMVRNPCAELYDDLLTCERKFGWKAMSGDRVSMHEHELVCSPEKRKFFRCREADRDRRTRLYRLRMRQARGEQVGLKSDPKPGETRPNDLQTKDTQGLGADKWFSGKVLEVWAGQEIKRTYDLPMEPTETVPPRYADDGGHH